MAYPNHQKYRAIICLGENTRDVTGHAITEKDAKASIDGILAASKDAGIDETLGGFEFPAKEPAPLPATAMTPAKDAEEHK